MRTYRIDTSSDLLQKYVIYFTEYKIHLCSNEIDYTIELKPLGIVFPVTKNNPKYYPSFFFFIYDADEEIQRMLGKINGKSFLPNNPIGFLEIIDTKTDQCHMNFQGDNEVFLGAEQKIINEISSIWHPELIKNAKHDQEWDLDFYKEVSDDPSKLGRYLRTINFPKVNININQKSSPGDIQDSLRNVTIPNERKWDRFAIERYNAGDTAIQISKEIISRKLGDVCPQTVYNRLSVLRRKANIPVSYHRDNFKNK